LTSLELTADINERRLALTRAREHGLNVHRVAVVTAERTIDRAFEVGGICMSRNSCAEHYLQLLPQMKGPLPSVIALQATPSDIELLLLRSIEWTTFEDGTYDTALEQATVILRYFLGKFVVEVQLSLLNPRLQVPGGFHLPKTLWRCFHVNSPPSINLRNEPQNTFTTDSSSRSGTVLTGWLSARV